MASLSSKLRYLLLQVRRADDPMRAQEVRCFSRALGCDADRIEVLDLIHEVPTPRRLRAVDGVLMGGSGDYSVAAGGDWLGGALVAMRELVEWNIPTYASCWGFQALARALGGEVVTDIDSAEVGTFEMQLTEAGLSDPVFAALGPRFLAQQGHQDIVTQLPPGAVLLATSARNRNQAFTLPGKPIYCSQFHPELDRQSLLERAAHYPEYVERVVGVSLEEFAASLQDTPQTDQLLERFTSHVFGERAERRA
ncbi:MAG: type 1 glutamine amidotransferase [Planctomycetota bacterium]|nr:MAG: type 1 glutamine amidotransferase [Planctomycetota bacterium]